MSLISNIEMFEDLAKADPQLMEALRAFRAAGVNNPELANHANTMARHIFSSVLIPRMGNSIAYEDHLSRHHNDGVHVHADLNDFGQINKTHGERMGDEAIKRFGNAAVDASRQFGGKAFHNHGDEFKFWFAKPEHAMGFARELRSRIEKEPPIGGTHNLATSMGIGHNHEHAERAMIEAKNQMGPKDARGHRLNTHSFGKAPTVIHSLIHEPTPPGWTPGKGKPEVAPKSIVPHGLKLGNPLKP